LPTSPPLSVALSAEFGDEFDELYEYRQKEGLRDYAGLQNTTAIVSFVPNYGFGKGYD